MIKSRTYLLVVINLMFVFFSYSQSTYKSIFSSTGEFTDAIKTDDGSFVAVGSSGNAEIVKLDSDGVLQWTTSLSNDQLSFVRSVAVNKKGDIFILGHINANGIGSIVLFKLDSDGVFQSSKRLFHSSTNSGWDLASDGKDGVYVLGGGCNGDNFLIHCDENLDIVWQRGYSVLLAATSQTIEPLSNGNFIIGGTAFNSEDGTRPFQVFEVDPDGALIWSKVFEGYSLGRIQRIIELKNGDLAMLYYAKLDPSAGTHIFVTRMTSAGVPIWTRILQHEWEQAKDFIELKDGELMLVGYNKIVGDGDAMIAKLDAQGSLSYVRNIPGQLWNSNGQQYINKILPICDDKFAVFGFLDGMMAAFVNESGEGFCESDEIPVSEFTVIDHELRELDLFVIQSPLTFEELDFEVTVKYDFLIENNFCSYVDPEDITCLPSSIEESLHDKVLEVYPNPTYDFLMFKTLLETPYRVHIFDNAGRKVLTPQVSKQKIDISQLKNGMYLIRILTDNSQYILRFLKQ